MIYPHSNQFEDLTQAQRVELRAEILAEELIKMLIEAAQATEKENWVAQT